MTAEGEDPQQVVERPVDVLAEIAMARQTVEVSGGIDEERSLLDGIRDRFVRGVLSRAQALGELKILMDRRQQGN